MLFSEGDRPKRGDLQREYKDLQHATKQMGAPVLFFWMHWTNGFRHRRRSFAFTVYLDETMIIEPPSTTGGRLKAHRAGRWGAKPTPSNTRKPERKGGSPPRIADDLERRGYGLVVPEIKDDE